jgi:hypothetical protein
MNIEEGRNASTQERACAAMVTRLQAVQVGADRLGLAADSVAAKTLTVLTPR